MDDSDEKYAVSIIGPGLTFERSVSLEQALLAASAASGQAMPAPVIGKGPVTPARDDSGPYGVSLREQLNAVGATQKTQQILVIADWIISETGAKDVSRDDIKERFADASEPLPGNFARDFQKVLKAGWLTANHTDRSRYYVTTTGKKAIQGKFA